MRALSTGALLQQSSFWPGWLHSEALSLQHAIAAGQLQIGLWCTLCSNVTTEIVSHSGFDWLLLDTEHAPNELAMLHNQLQAMVGGTASAVVRPPWNDTVVIKRLLDVGVQTLLIPMVQNAEEAKRAVAATRYPPEGVRGLGTTTRANNYGRVKDYLKRVNDELCVIVQIETREALGNLEAIAAVDGVDGLYLATAFSGSGFKIAPAVGQCMAELITEGRAKTVDLTAFGLRRFAEGRSPQGPYPYAQRLDHAEPGAERPA